MTKKVESGRKRGFSHESINTVIAVLGFSLALVTAVSEFLGPSDRFSATVQGYSGSSDITVAMGEFPHWDTRRPTGILQFVTYEILLHNQSEENISITDLSLGVQSETHGIIFDSTLSAYALPRGTISGVSGLPLTVPANEAIVVFVRATLPYDVEAGRDNNCISAGRSFMEIENCLEEHGRDLAGNSFEVISEGNTKRRTYSGEKRSLLLVFRFQAADGTHHDAPSTIVF